MLYTSHGGARKKDTVTKRKNTEKAAKRTVNATTDNEDEMETVQSPNMVD